MTTNSPNPVDGDDQALIADCQHEIATLTDHIERMKRRKLDTFLDLSEYESQLKRQQVALAALTAEPVAWAHRLVNKCNGTIHPWIYGSKEKEPSEGDIFRVEIMPLYAALPAQLLRPVEMPDQAPNALIALCQQVYDSRITGASVAQDVWQDCLDELRQQGIEVKS